ncbi:unnamed protein product [Discula destructiva]
MATSYHRINSGQVERMRVAINGDPMADSADAVRSSVAPSTHTAVFPGLVPVHTEAVDALASAPVPTSSSAQQDGRLHNGRPSHIEPRQASQVPDTMNGVPHTDHNQPRPVQAGPGRHYPQPYDTSNQGGLCAKRQDLWAPSPHNRQAQALGYPRVPIPLVHRSELRREERHIGPGDTHLPVAQRFRGIPSHLSGAQREPHRLEVRHTAADAVLRSFADYLDGDEESEASPRARIPYRSDRLPLPVPVPVPRPQQRQLRRPQQQQHQHQQPPHASPPPPPPPPPPPARPPADLEAPPPAPTLNPPVEHLTSTSWGWVFFSSHTCYWYRLLPASPVTPQTPPSVTRSGKPSLKAAPPPPPQHPPALPRWEVFLPQPSHRIWRPAHKLPSVRASCSRAVANLPLGHPARELWPRAEHFVTGWFFFHPTAHLWLAFQNDVDHARRGWYLFRVPMQRWMFYRGGDQWCPCCARQLPAQRSRVCRNVDRDGRYVGPGAEGPGEVAIAEDDVGGEGEEAPPARGPARFRRCLRALFGRRPEKKADSASDKTCPLSADRRAKGKQT